ncbi:hypothetical protein DRZ77_01100 [Candidatus Woesearchaeota archaeon]|nr:MAG: hypothetical protein DRZ77_01100 [Candidatus Woesearchaeota archaeon]
MVVLIKKRLGKQIFYYLRHVTRVKGRYRTIEKYLGKSLPKNLEVVMIEFFREVYSQTYDEIERLRKRFIQLGKKLPNSVKEKQLMDFGIRFTYNTDRIEGSTLTLRDTTLVIEKGIIPRNKLLADVKEAENHFNVFMEMLKEKKISLHKVLEWHYKLFKDTKKDIAGKIRKHQVRISGSKFVPPTPAELNALLSEFFRWLNRSLNRVHPVEVAGLAHLKFVTIHPFADGNGRVSRLLINWILWHKNYPMFIIEYRNRARYYSALERAQTKKNEFIFLRWFIKEYKRAVERELKC